MIKSTENNKKESKIWNNKFFILLGTYLIAFINGGFTLPLPIVSCFIEIIDANHNVNISPIGLMLGVFSIIGVFIVQFNYRKKELKWIIFQLAVVCIMYLSWLFLDIYGIIIEPGSFDRVGYFPFTLLFSAPFQITTYVIFNKLKKQFDLIRVARHN